MCRTLRLIMASVVAFSMVTTPAFSQDLRQLIEEMKKRKTGTEEAPKIETIGLEREEEKPRLIPGVEIPETVPLDKRINPEEYIVGPGDEFTIYLWGLLDEQQIASVTPEGKLLIPYVGAIDVSGKTLAQARQEIVDRVKDRYDKVDVSVVLSKLRKFRIFITGHVRNPGSYTAWPVDRAWDAIEKAGGVSGNGSKRNILVRRQTGEVLHVDLARFLKLGSLEDNPYMKMGDVIYVPVRGEIVAIVGEVNDEGTYEFKPGENVEDIIELAGGVKPGADLRMLEVVRFKEDGMTRERIFPNIVQSPGGDGEANPGDDPSAQLLGLRFPLQKDDQIIIRKIPEWHPKRAVNVWGEVKYPGLYPIEEGRTTLTDLINQAGGFTKRASLRDAKVVRWQAREIRDPEFERLLKMSVDEMTDLEYEYFKTKLREESGVVSLDFMELFLKGERSKDVVLKAGDIIFVPRQREMINITGQANRPGLVNYEPDEKVDFYIKRAGGYAWNADKGKMRVIKGDTGLWLHPREVKRLEPGDVIFIPEKPERDWWEWIGKRTGVLGDLFMAVTTAYIVNQVTK